MNNTDDKLEKSLTAIFAAIGIIAVAINLFVKGVNTEHLLDALKDLAGLIVVVAVFLVATKMFKKMTYSDFKELFEKYLKEWIKTNEYLIDTNKRTSESEDKEFYLMLTKDHHKNIVYQDKPASEFPEKGAANVYHKGAFLYTDTENKGEIIIGINKSLFLKKEYADRLDEVAEKLKERIIDFSIKFSFEGNSNKLQFDKKDVIISSKGTRIKIVTTDIKKNENNARVLVNLLEYIKTMILALA